MTYLSKKFTTNPRFLWKTPSADTSGLLKFHLQFSKTGRCNPSCNKKASSEAISSYQHRKISPIALGRQKVRH